MRILSIAIVGVLICIGIIFTYQYMSHSEIPQNSIDISYDGQSYRGMLSFDQEGFFFLECEGKKLFSIGGLPKDAEELLELERLQDSSVTYYADLKGEAIGVTTYDIVKYPNINIIKLEKVSGVNYANCATFRDYFERSAKL